MKNRTLRVCLFSGVLLLAASGIAAKHVISDHRPTSTKASTGQASARRISQITVQRSTSAYGQLPLSFEPNQGQADPAVKFISHGAGYSVLLASNQAVLSLEHPDDADQALAKMDARTRKRFESRRFYKLSPRFHRRQQKNQLIRVTMEGANPSANVTASNQLPGKANYFIGRDRRKWRTGIPTYGTVKYSGIYPGTDLIYYGKQGHLEFDFALAPGADANAIRLHFDAPGPLSITKTGELSIATSQSSFELLRPEIYQVRSGKRVPVLGQFVFRGDEKTVGIDVPSFDHKEKLIIDPVLSYSTYLGGNGSDYASGVAVDSQGDAYIAGQTTSSNFPTYNGYASSGDSNGVAFVTELNPTGTAVLYSTYLGGSGGDWGAGVALDPSGNVYITGSTLSTDFPVVNAVQTSLLSSNGNVFVARISTTQTGTASLVYSTYLGGGGNTSNSLGDVGLGIAADSSGLAYITGQTASDSSTAPFPTTSNTLQSSLASANGNAFLSVLDTTNGGPLSLIYSTYLGGASSGFGDYGVGITVDASGDAFITGQTTSGSSGPFPTTSGAYQTTLNSQNGNVFVSEIATGVDTCQCLVYSTYLGGSSSIIVGDVGSGIGLDSSGNIYVGGDTTSSDFPITTGAFQTTNSPAGKAFVAAFNPAQSGSQSLIYSTYLGGTNGSEGEVINALAVDGNGNTAVAGSTSSSDFPTTAGAFQTTIKNSSWDAFLSRLNPMGTALLYSTYFGGSCANGDLGNGVALDWLDNPYLAGSTCSTDFSVYPANAYQTSLQGTYNAFVAKFALSPNPGIQATASPTPNSNGWNNSAVTVSFNCIPGGAPLQSCTSPTDVTSEGANQVVSGTVVDTDNEMASASVSVNMDLTPPVLSITSPSNGSTSNSSSLTITGTVTDALSGVSSVSCNGVQASITGTSFSCAITISSASNSIAVIGTDVAGNTTTVPLAVNLVIPGGSASTWNLNVARQGHTATLLTNGMVLIAGGNNASFVEQSSAELYNPATETFALTGSMTTPRINHTATLLNDGTVLMAGGYDINGVPLNSAEIYNPSTGVFTATGNMTSGRASHSATLLSDGTVLIAGGYDSNFNALASAELYDPATGTFVGVGNLATGRASHTATLLNDGQVLVAGGEDSNYNALAAAELYDPSSRTFTTTGNLNTARELHTATLLNSGLVLIAGGQDSYNNAQSGAELYDPSAGTFSVTGSMTTVRVEDTATLLNNGTVLLAGGTDNNDDFFSSTELYDPISQTFSASGSMTIARANHSATLLNDGTVLLAGGFENTGLFDPTLASSEVYTPPSFAPVNLVSIAVNPPVPSISAGTVQRFTATGTFSDDSTEVLSSTTWSSTDNTVATLTNDSTNKGAAYGVATGSATVSACTGSICGSTTVTVTTPQLTITSLSPSAGNIGAPVILAGTGFGAAQGNSTVTFNGTAATVGVWSATGISTTVPAGATTGNVVATVGDVNSNGVLFTVSSGPVISGLSPNSGFAGTAVAISGANFGASPDSSTVTFNGLPATIVSWSDSSIGVNVPPGATTGNVVVMVSSAASNAVLFTVPTITEVTPSAGPIGTLVTIGGVGFGATQGSGSITINGTAMQVVSWSDSSILATVATNTTSGNLTVQQGTLSISGPAFTVGGTSPYNVSPQSISLLVGQSRTISVTDNNGNPVTGLQWISTNPSIVSLSTDNPPAITGVAAGSATVYAGVVPISVTVYSGSSLPAGTPLWSLPVGGSGVAQIVPAVPSGSGVDTFALDSAGTLWAVKSDGTVAWTVGVGVPAKVIPDFSGNAYVMTPYSYYDGQGNYHNSWQLKAVNPTTGQLTVLYTFAGKVTLAGGGPIWPDTELAIPDTTGMIFIQDNSTAGVLNPSNGQLLTSITLENTNLVWAGSSEIQPPMYGQMIVAGDGNAYVPYVYYNSVSTAPEGVNAGTDQEERYLKALRLSPDGSYAKTQLAYGSATVTTQTCTGSGTFAALATPNVITNADQGVAIFAEGGGPCGDSPGEIATYVSGDSVTSQYTAASISGFTPTLQREDGSYIGNDGYDNFDVIASDGSIVWSIPLGQSINVTPLAPLYATSDGGVIVTTTQNGQLGTLYTLDQNGNITSQTADTGSQISWDGESFVTSPNNISAIEMPITDVDPISFWADAGGNPSHSGVATVQCGCILQSTDGESSDDRLSRPELANRSGDQQKPRLLLASFHVSESGFAIAAIPAAPPTPAPAVNCPLCNLQSETCSPISGTGSVYLILIGDPGINTPNGDHNVGSLFGLAAQTQANTLQSQGNAVIACRVSSVQDIENALTTNGVINGGVYYFGHGSHVYYSGDPTAYSAINPGEEAGFYTNVTVKNVNLLSNAELGQYAEIWLYGCRAGEDPGGSESIARVLANQLHRNVHAYPVGVYFSQSDADHDQHFSGLGIPHPPASLPMYSIPEGAPGHKPEPILFLAH